MDDNKSLLKHPSLSSLTSLGAPPRTPGTPRSDIGFGAEDNLSITFSAISGDVSSFTSSSCSPDISSRRSSQVYTRASDIHAEPYPCTTTISAATDFHLYTTINKWHIFHTFPLVEMEKLLASIPGMTARLQRAFLLYYDAYIDFCKSAQEVENIQGKILIVLKLLELFTFFPQGSNDTYILGKYLRAELRKYGYAETTQYHMERASIAFYIENKLGLSLSSAGIASDLSQAARGRLTFLGVAEAQKYNVFPLHGRLFHRTFQNSTNWRMNYPSPTLLKANQDKLDSRERALRYFNSSEQLSSSLYTLGNTLQVVGELAGSQEGFCCYVMDKSGNFYSTSHLKIDATVSEEALENEQASHLSGFSHSSYFPSSSIGCCGTWKVVDGELKAITNASNHFRPGNHHLYFCLLQLQKEVDLNDVDVFSYVPLNLKDSTASDKPSKLSRLVYLGKAPDFMRQFITGMPLYNAEQWYKRKLIDQTGTSPTVEIPESLATETTGAQKYQLVAQVRDNDLIKIAKHFMVETTPAQESKEWESLSLKILNQQQLTAGTTVFADQEADDLDGWV